MNVGELIEKLSTLDPALPVICHDRYEGWQAVVKVYDEASDYGWYDGDDRRGEGKQACHLGTP